jgi:AcrR family transcriptional regulator
MARISQELKDQTRACIIKEAETLFNTVGYEQTKTKVIAKACQIAEGTLFNYFENKEAILLAVFDQMADIDENLIQMEKIKEEMMVDIILYPVRKLKAYSKSFMIDLTTASLKIAKKNKKLFESLVALDYKYMNELKRRFDQYISFKDTLITSIEFSEMLYAIVAAEFIFYLYEKDRSYEEFELRATQKIKALLKPYLGD